MLQRYSFYFNYQTNFKFLKRKRDKKKRACHNKWHARYSFISNNSSFASELHTPFQGVLGNSNRTGRNYSSSSFSKASTNGWWKLWKMLRYSALTSSSSSKRFNSPRL